MWILSTYFFMTVWQVCELFAQPKGSTSVFGFRVLCSVLAADTLYAGCPCT